MANATTLPETNAREQPAGTKPLTPPEERFWKRYSTHGELPLSSLASFAIHALILGALVLWFFYLAAFFHSPTRDLPIDPVRLAVGGGGGKPQGVGNAPGIGEAVEAAAAR